MRIFLILLLFLQSTTYTHDELMGKIDPATHPDFIEISKEHASREGMYLRKEAYEAFCEMYTAASEAGHHLQIISATRSFAHQKRIWDGKWERTKYMGWPDGEKAVDIMLYSSMPGTSRHHWGTDMDLNALENSYFESGKGLALYTWLQQHADEYGYRQVYTSKENGRTGYEEEKWHWSYMPLATPMLEQYLREITYDDLNGFQGAGTSEELEVITKFVRGIE